MFPESALLDKRSIRSIIRSDVKLSHSRHNSDKIQGLLICWKCKEARTRGRAKSFDNCASLYQHLVTNHNDIDRDCYPSIENCIETLQIISDLISIGVLK